MQEEDSDKGMYTHLYPYWSGTVNTTKTETDSESDESSSSTTTTYSSNSEEKVVQYEYVPINEIYCDK